MKKILTVLIMASAIVSIKAQRNTGFENLNNKGNISNWGKIVLMTFNIDSAGHSIDSLVYGNPNGFYYPTPDAHSGQRAMEMQNAYNFGTGDAYAGGANLSDNDSDYTGFGTSLVAIPAHVNEFSFYYKYFPLNNDSAQASIEVFDSNANEIGTALIVISGTTSSYKLAKTRIQFTSPGVAAYVSIHFSTFYTSSYKSRKPSLGSTFIVDDVTLANTVGIQSLSNSNDVLIYPNPCKDAFSISSQEPILGIKVYDLVGREIAMPATSHISEVNTSILPSGNYIIQIITATAVLAKKIIVD